MSEAFPRDPPRVHPAHTSQQAWSTRQFGEDEEQRAPSHQGSTSWSPSFIRDGGYCGKMCAVGYSSIYIFHPSTCGCILVSLLSSCCRWRQGGRRRARGVQCQFRGSDTFLRIVGIIRHKQAINPHKCGGAFCRGDETPHFLFSTAILISAAPILTVYIVDSLPSAPPRTPVEQQHLSSSKDSERV